MEAGGKRLDGRAAIVTGGAVGIGAAVARRLAQEGAKVVVADVKAGEGAASVASLRNIGAEAIFLPTDVS